MPSPSLPGSQAATKASEWLSSLLTHAGRPDKNTVTTGIPLLRMLRNRAKSVLLPR